MRTNRIGWKRGVAAGLTLASVVTVIAVLVLPTAALGRTARCVGNKKVSIYSFDPHIAKAGSNTTVHVMGRHLGVVIILRIGPKGMQTVVSFTHVGDTIEFMVPSDAVSGPIQVEDCAGNTDWSGSSLRV